MTVGRFFMTAGGVLQLAGVAAIFVEVGQTERLLRLQSWWRRIGSDVGRILSSIGRWLGWRHTRQVELRGAVEFGAATDAVGRLTITHAEGSTVEERLESHRLQLMALHEELERVWQRLDQDRAEQRSAANEVEARLSSEVASLRKLLTELSGGFLRGRALGGGLILVGTALITIGVWL